MICPHCGVGETKIIDTDKSPGWAVLRIRRCDDCRALSHTWEIPYSKVAPPEKPIWCRA